MRIDVVTVFPQEFRACVGFGVIGRAIERGVVELHCASPRDYAEDRRGTVDDRPFGGGPGMVLAIEPLRRCLEAVRDAAAEPVPVAALGPQGRRFDQAAAAVMAARPRVALVCGRYEGIDERLLASCVDEEWSVGDYVISGGELAAAIIIDAVVRLLPGTLGHAGSAAADSFAGGLLDCPHYTRPERSALGSVPEVLTSGDHGAVERWRLRESLGRTWLRRPDLLANRRLDGRQRELLADYIGQYMAGP